MIRTATKDDIKGIIVLWNEAFGDSEDDIRFFLDNRFEPKNTLVNYIDNEVVSMLFLLEGDMVIDGESYPSYYLYAACTAKKCRGRGLMAELLNEAKSLAAERNKYFICLMPGEKSLFDFYARFGYKAVFSRKILKVELSDLPEIENPCNELNFSDYSGKRRNAFSKFNRFEWDNMSIDFACKHHLLYGGKELNSCNGYLLYGENESAIYVKEFAFAEEIGSVLANLLIQTKSKKAIINLPSDYQTAFGQYEIIDSAMAVSVKPEFDSIISGLKNAYLGLTLD